MDIPTLVKQLQEHCNTRNAKWRHVVGPTNYTLPVTYFQQPHPKYLKEFVDHVALNGVDHRGRSVMHVTAYFGEPAICKIFIDLGTTTFMTDIDGKHPLHYAAVGRVTPENVKELIRTIWDWDPKRCIEIMQDSHKLGILLNDALSTENYAFYLEMLRMSNKSYSTPLARMKEPRSLINEEENYKHKEPKYDKQTIKEEEHQIPSLTNMCLSIAKLQALGNPNFRKKMKAELPSEVLQRFVDCLPIDEFSPRLLDFFGGCPGVVVDVRQQYWSIYQREYEFRKTSRENWSGFQRMIRFTNLTSVYDNLHKFQHPPKDKYDSPQIAKRIFENFRPYSGCPIVPQEKFKKSFSKFTHDLLEGFDWSNMVVIGGSVLGNLMPSTKGPNPFKNSDIDICFYGLGPSKFSEKLHKLITHIQTKCGYVLTLSTHESLVLCMRYPFRRIQIMKGMWDSIERILMHVDIDCTGVGYNGNQVLATPRAILALNRCWSVVTQMHYAVRGLIEYEKRLVKYAYRGFTIVDFNFPMETDIIANLKPHIERIDHGSQLQPHKHDYLNLNGINLLLLIELMSGKVDYDIWECREHEADLPNVSKEWPPQRIRKELEAGKIVYHSYGVRQEHYRSKYRPVPRNPKKAKEYLTPISYPESEHYVFNYLYGSY